MHSDCQRYSSANTIFHKILRSLHNKKRRAASLGPALYFRCQNLPVWTSGTWRSAVMGWFRRLSWQLPPVLPHIQCPRNRNQAALLHCVQASCIMRFYVDVDRHRWFHPGENAAELHADGILIGVLTQGNVQVDITEHIWLAANVCRLQGTRAGESYSIHKLFWLHRHWFCLQVWGLRIMCDTTADNVPE